MENRYSFSYRFPGGGGGATTIAGGVPGMTADEIGKAVASALKSHGDRVEFSIKALSTGGEGMAGVPGSMTISGPWTPGHGGGAGASGTIGFPHGQVNG